MPEFRQQKQTFCMHYKKGEVSKVIPLEHQLMDETGKSRSEVHKDAIKHYWNSRQASKLQLVWGQYERNETTAKIKCHVFPDGRRKSKEEREEDGELPC